MSDTSDAPATTPPAPKWKPLEPNARRVLGVLIEKAKTTPAGYPMSVNAIVTGCNQKNNRDPVMSLDDIEVEKALETLRVAGAVSEVDWVGRVSKFKHHAYEWLGVSKVEIAVMTELLLRGAQQLGELRGRAARMESIADLAELKPIVAGLIERGLMIELTPPGRGQIVSHNLYPGAELAEVQARQGGQASGAHADDEGESGARSHEAPARTGAGTTAAELAALSAQVAELRAEMARLSERIRELETQTS